MKRLAPGLLVIALGAAAYLPVFSAEYVWDDLGAQPASNPVLAESFRAIWLTPKLNPWEGHYWPVTYSTFRIEYLLWGAGPLGSHALNLLLHLLNSLLLLRLLRLLRIDGAEFAAMLFAVHPVHAESVAWVIERKDMLSGFFYLLAALVWLGGPQRRSPLRTAAFTFCFLLALLSKSVALTLPVALLIIEAARRRGPPPRALLSMLPAALVGAAVTFFDLRFNAWREGAFTIDLAPADRVLLVARAFWFYVGKLAFPGTLTTIYPRWEMSESGIEAGVALFSLASLIAAAAVALLRSRSAPVRSGAAAFLCYGLTLAPVLGAVNFGFMTMSFVADRYQYLASLYPIAFGCAATSALLSRLRTTSLVRLLLPASLILLSTALTFRHAALWKNDHVLFTQNIRINPSSAVAYHALGLFAAREGDDRAAEAHYLRCLEIDPKHPEAWNNLGTVLHRRRDYPGAIRAFTRAVAHRPGYPAAWMNLGITFEMTGNPARAIEAYTYALELDPKLDQVREKLNQLLAAHPELTVSAVHPGAETPR